MREIRPIQKMRGATLVVALIMLVLIAIIGFGAMQTTTMEEKMSGNLRDKNISFQAAEAGLRERWVFHLVL
jgi:type IV pilus assembly protein PilX